MSAFRLPPLIQGMALIAFGGVVLGAVGNAISPVGLTWRHDWTHDAWNQALAAGYRPLTPRQALEFVESESGFIADARDPASFERSHLPRATPVPWQVARDFLDTNAAKLPRDTPILVYCSGTHCEAALVVADFFHAYRYTNISILVDGFEGWSAFGGPTEKGMQ